MLFPHALLRRATIAQTCRTPKGFQNELQVLTEAAVAQRAGRCNLWAALHLIAEATEDMERAAACTEQSATKPLAHIPAE